MFVLSWFPRLPDWNGLHPALVHFPVALLLIAPLLVAASLFVRSGWRAWAGAALVLMALGTLAAWLAVGSGHAAGQLVDRTPEIERALLRHEALGVATRNLFTLLTAAYALLLVGPLRARRAWPDAWRYAAYGAFLAAYVGCTGVLAHTADAGGHLVHVDGVRAMVEPPLRPSATPVADVTAESPPPGGVPRMR